MRRDISAIKRDLEDKRNNDIIVKKGILKEMFCADPDIMEVLGQKEERPLNKYVDPDAPTGDELKERRGILEYNQMVSRERVLPYLKLNGIQKEVLNFIMFDIDDATVSNDNPVIKSQSLVVMCLVHEDDMETPYGIVRTDLLSYLVKDLLNWSNVLGMQTKCVNDYSDIVDSRYYCRTLKFRIDAPNVNPRHRGMNNLYDGF